jgi:hypothetical protein
MKKLLMGILCLFLACGMAFAAGKSDGRRGLPFAEIRVPLEPHTSGPDSGPHTRKQPPPFYADRQRPVPEDFHQARLRYLSAACRGINDRLGQKLSEN